MIWKLLLITLAQVCVAKMKEKSSVLLDRDKYSKFPLTTSDNFS